MDTERTAAVDSFACTSCGAELKFKPGTTMLTCEHCGAGIRIPYIDVAIEELDFHAYLAGKTDEAGQMVESFVRCDSCGASCTLAPHVTAADCVYCGAPLVVARSKEETVIQPRSLLPFELGKDKALACFKGWVSERWFAPNDLKKAALNFDHFKGVYIPYWTFDTNTFSSYVGQRGDYYYVTEHYTTIENGKTVRRTRQVRKIRWSFASGHVREGFDDILIVASRTLPPKRIDALAPWDLASLVPFERSYLGGFIAEKYQVELEEGFDVAKEIADQRIRQLVKRDIGGDEQRITRINTQYNDISFKHLLLPVYVCAYRYKGKTYQFLVNGRTGEVQGDRPFSWVKIASLAVGILLAVMAGVAIFGLTR